MRRSPNQTYVSARFRAVPKTRLPSREQITAQMRKLATRMWIGEKGPEMVMPLNVSISVKSTPSPNDLLRLLADYKKRNPRNPA